MPRKRDGFVPLGDVAESVALPGDRALTHRAATPPARRRFTRLDQVTQLVNASEADAEVGFMARLLALCSLPRTNPGNRLRYIRRNGSYTLVMNAGGLYKLPFGNLPRLLLAYVTTEAVRTQSPVLTLETVEFATLEWVDWFNHRRLLTPIGHVPPGGVRTAVLSGAGGSSHDGRSQVTSPLTNPGRFK